MTGRHKFRDLRTQREVSPENAAKLSQLRHAMDDALALGRVREARNLTQEKMALAMSVSQANISRIEHEEDVYLSTLREYVKALGGELRLEAVFADEVISLVGQSVNAASEQSTHDLATLSAESD